MSVVNLRYVINPSIQFLSTRLLALLITFHLILFVLAQTNSSKVKIADVSFKGIRGTSSTKAAIRLLCSKDIPCEKVELADIDLKYEGKEGAGAISECKNVKPMTTGKIIPEACAAPVEPFKEKGGEADSSS